MEKIDRQRAPKRSVTVEKKRNSYEARVTLELVNIMEGADKNPRLSKIAKTEEDAKKRLGKLIVDVYFEAQKKSNSRKIFSDECTEELDKFEEHRKKKDKGK